MYKLYVGKVEDMPKDEKYTFYNSDSGYLLIYTESKPQGEFYEVTDELYDKLSATEKMWLMSTKMEINAQFVKLHEVELTEKMNRFVTELENEFEKIRREHIVNEK